MLKKTQNFLSGPAGYLILLGCSVGAAAMMQLGAVPVVAKQERSAIQVNTTYAESAEQLQLRAMARVTVAHQVQLVAALDSEVIDVKVEKGQRVESGQLLIQMDTKDAMAQFYKAKAETARVLEQKKTIATQLEDAKSVLQQLQQQLTLQLKQQKRTKTLQVRKLASDAQVEDAAMSVLAIRTDISRQKESVNTLQGQVEQLEQSINQAKADVISAQKNLERTKVLAPAAGEISSVSTAAGEYVLSGNPLLGFQASSAVELMVAIPERWVTLINRLPEKERSQINLEWQGKTFPFKRLTGFLEEGNGQFSAYFVLGEQSLLSVGQVIDVQLNVPVSRSWLRLPRSVLQPGNKLFQVDNGILLDRKPSFFTSGEWLVLPEAEQGPELPWLNGYVPGAFSGQQVSVVEADDV